MWLPLRVLRLRRVGQRVRTSWSLLKFTSRSGRARTPISMALSERTLGISYNKGALGNIETVLPNQDDIQSGRASDRPNGFFYAIETIGRGSFMLQFQSGKTGTNLLPGQMLSWLTAATSSSRTALWCAVGEHLLRRCRAVRRPRPSVRPVLRY
jgi:hypothetical protein